MYVPEVLVEEDVNRRTHSSSLGFRQTKQLKDTTDLVKSEHLPSQIYRAHEHPPLKILDAHPLSL